MTARLMSPTARLARMDLDTTSARWSHQAILDQAADNWKSVITL